MALQDAESSEVYKYKPIGAPDSLRKHLDVRRMFLRTLPEGLHARVSMTQLLRVEERCRLTSRKFCSIHRMSGPFVKYGTSWHRGTSWGRATRVFHTNSVPNGPRNGALLAFLSERGVTWTT